MGHTPAVSQDCAFPAQFAVGESPGRPITLFVSALLKQWVQLPERSLADFLPGVPKSMKDANFSRRRKITESHNVRDWKGTQKII